MKTIKFEGYLLPCPFCGAKGQLLRCATRYHITCSGCQARTMDCNSIHEAKALWDRRKHHYFNINWY